VQGVTSQRSVVVPITITVVALLSVTLIAYSLNNGTLPLWTLSANRLVNLTFTTQFMVLPVSFVALMLMYLYDKANFKTFFRFSFASDNKNEWLIYGPIVAVAFTVGTAMMMSFNVMSQHGTINDTFFELLPLVLLFAITNAWSEEIFSRFVIVAGLHGRLQPNAICMISATIFGLGHFYGTPSGIFGVIASGTLGWFLAKSVVETRSLGWALLIHFLQDVVIFGAGAMVLAGQE
jgi:membrane protease YdiL (CAAX protease family)